MENKIIFIIVLVVIGVIAVLQFSKKEESIDTENKICFYYRFAGDVEWLKSQIARYRFDALKYLFPCKNKEESDFRIAVSDIEGEIVADFYATEFNYSKKSRLSPIIKNQKLSDEQYEYLLECLKETYMEDEKRTTFSAEKVE